MEKPFRSNDAIVVEFDTVDTTTLDSPTPFYHRNCYIVKAHPGVNADDILSEVQEIEDNTERGYLVMPHQSILTTTLTEYPELVVGLTYDGFVKIAQGFQSQMKNSLKRERYRALADDLVRIRDNQK